MRRPLPGVFDRYVIAVVGRATALVLLLLLALSLIAEWIDQHSSRVGYAQALHFAWLTVPRRASELVPFVALFGVLGGLGALGGAQELTAARAAGVSVRRIVVMALVPAVLLQAGGLALGEWLIPRAEARIAERQAADDAALGWVPLQWARAGDDFVAARAFDDAGRLYGVWGFAFAGTELREAWQAGRAEAPAAEPAGSAAGRHADRMPDGSGPGARLLRHDVRSTWLDGRTVRAGRAAVAPLALPLRASDFQVRRPRDAERMSLRGLAALVSRLQRQFPDSAAWADVARRLDVVLWRRLAQPLAVLLLSMIGAGFVFGPLRGVGMGARLAAGTLLALGFKYASDLVAPLVVIYALPAWLAAALPLAALALLAARVLRRVA